MYFSFKENLLFFFQENAWNESEPKEDGSKYCPFDPLDNVTSIHVRKYRKKMSVNIVPLIP